MIEDVMRIVTAGHSASARSCSEHPMDEVDLRFYIALALVERLERAESHTGVAQWLDALDAMLCDRHLESEAAS